MIETSPKLLSSVGGVVKGNDKKPTTPTVVSPTINSTTPTLSTKEKSHVRELKRLFESKRSSISSPLKILPSFKSNKHKDKSNTEELVINDKLLPPIVSSTTSKSPITNNSSTVNLDNIISQADRKYYFYVNEAIRKNQPIVPSLAIRRKSIDLTHSPIKGSLYAQKYQHSYSPSTRTIQVTKTNNNSNNGNGLSNFNSSKPPVSPQQQTVSIAASPSTSSENLSIDTIENNDTTWIKQKSKANDDYFTDRNVSPSRLPVSRSTFDLKVGKNQSKEEPVNIKFNSSVLPTSTSGTSGVVSSSKPPSSSKTFRFPFSKGKEKSSSFVISGTQANDDSNNHDGSISSSSSSGGKLEKESKKDHKKKHHHSQDNESTHHHTDTHHNNEINSKTSSVSLEEDKPSRLFPWVTLRRIKRSNTADISPIKQQQDIKIVKSKIDISHNNQPLLSTVQIVHKASTTTSVIPSTTTPYNKLTDPIELQKKLNRLSIKQLLEEEKIKQLEENVENGFVTIDEINNNEHASKLIEVTEEEIDEQLLIQEEMEEEKTSPYSEDANSSNNSSTGSNISIGGQKQTYVSLSTTILKKDLLNRTSISSPCSPSTSPSQSRLISSSLPPKKYVSIAMAIRPTGTSADSKSIISLSANNVRTPPNEEDDDEDHDEKVKSPTIIISNHNQPPIMSAPTSPTLSSSSTLPSKMGYTHDDGFILDHTATPLSPPSNKSQLNNGKPPVLNHRLDQLLNSHRGRSASVGSIFEQMTKFVIDDIPPLKVHCSSLDECMETFSKPDPPHGRCFVLDLGNCSLGDEGLTVLSDNFPGRLEIADLSWNDIGSDGMDNFCSMLRREKNYIQSLSLMGNSLNPQMIDLLLESIEIKDPLANKQNQPKKGYKGFGLNLKETGIENEGAEYIAMYIAANKYPNIIGLDLTSSSVTDVAMSELSAGLIKTVSLTTLILDENYLGDDGALLLADGLKYNKSLTHLQIRNTDIGERGTIEICNACKFNNTITLLDISLNPWQFAGEISLQSLKILKQQLYLKSISSGNNNGAEKILPKIVWKDDGMESSLEVEEILDIVVHFGVDKIVDVLMNGISFSPLIENEKLFEYMTLEAKHINKIFSRIIAPHLDTADHLNSLKLLVALLPIHLRENETFLNSFLDNLSSLFSLLDKSGGSGGKVDFLLLDLLDFFTLVIKSDHRECYEKINQCNLFSKTLQLFFTHHNHNILHQNILGLITETTQSTYLNFYEGTTFTNDFFNRLLSFVTDEHSKSPGLRKSNYAHSIEISNLLDSRSNSPYLSTPQWLNFKSTILAKELHLQNNYLCGIVPDRNQKVDQSILSKFEKEFKK